MGDGMRRRKRPIEAGRCGEMQHFPRCSREGHTHLIVVAKDVRAVVRASCQSNSLYRSSEKKRSNRCSRGAKYSSEMDSSSLLGFRFRFLMKQNNIVSLRHELRRQRRNNVLLLLIVSLYAISWLPFNIAYIFFTYISRLRRSGEVLLPPEREFAMTYHCSFVVSLDDPVRGEEKSELSNYLPLRFLICMISAISNPFLYSYFDETFKDGLHRIFLLFCPRIHRTVNQVSLRENGNIVEQVPLSPNAHRLVSDKSIPNQSTVKVNG